MNMLWTRLYLFAYVTEVFCVRYIMLRDEDFVGPDKGIQEALEKKMRTSARDQATLEALRNITTTGAVPAMFHERTRRNEQTKTHLRAVWKRKKHKKTFNTAMFLQNMKFLIYGVQNRLEDIQHILEKYEKDARFRFGHIFCKLDHWKEDIMAMFVKGTGLQRRIENHIFLYSHILAKNVDITLTVEYIAYLMTEYTKIVKKRNEGKLVLSTLQKERVETMQKEMAGKDKQYTEDEIREIVDKLEKEGYQPPD